MIAQILLALGLAYQTWSLVAMEMNYRRAASMGIPLVRLPIDPENIIWLVLEPHLWRLLDHLPFSWGTFGRYSRRGWHFKDKANSHLRYGPAWALVTPAFVYIYVADPDAVHDIFVRRGDFLRPSKMYKLLEVYGPCISTASWTDWPRHRKVLAAPFNENIMEFVWNESLDQAREMLKSWTSLAGSETPSFAMDTRTLSLNVLAATGFHRSYQFRSSVHSTIDEAQTYRNASQTVLDNAIFPMLVPPRLMLLPFLPKSWIRIGNAAKDFKTYMIQMLDEETSLLSRGERGTGSLMTSFIQALDTHQKDASTVKSDANQSPAKGLTVDEIFGNIFVINFAGHDTTANTLAFTMLLLAVNPEVQDWVSAELQELTKDGENAKMDYSLLFPKLLRCRAVMVCTHRLHHISLRLTYLRMWLECLRLYPPIMALPKWTNEHSQTLRLGQRTIVVPPQMGVMPSLLALQTHPDYWPDPLLWKPSRWISSSPPAAPPQISINNTATTPPPSHQESLITPAPSTYFPWSDGPQNCPGAKLAQVEFVAVLACLLRDHRVGVVCEPGESSAQARERALATSEDCDMTLLLRMRDADKVKLAWKRV